MSTRLYVEGGGDHKPLRTECRKAFRAFLLNAGLAGHMPRVFASGSRQQAYDDFRQALGGSCDDDRVVLLVDSEGPVAKDTGPWQLALGDLGPTYRTVWSIIEAEGASREGMES